MLGRQAGFCLRRAAQRLFSEHAPTVASIAGGDLPPETLQQPQPGRQPARPAASAVCPGGSVSGAGRPASSAAAWLPRAVQQLQRSCPCHAQQPGDLGSARITAAAPPLHTAEATVFEAPNSWGPVPGSWAAGPAAPLPHSGLQPPPPLVCRPAAAVWHMGSNSAAPHTQRLWRSAQATSWQPWQPHQRQPPSQPALTRGFATAWQRGRNQAAANRRGGRAVLPEPPRKPRVNSEIDGPHVRLVFPDNTHKVMRTQDARRAAREFKMDLVEVDARVKPPVCKLLEAGKAAYQAAQRDKDHKKKLQELQRKQVIKEVRFSPTTAGNDIQEERVARWHEKKRLWHEENPGRPFPKGIKFPKPQHLLRKKKKRKGPITWPKKTTKQRWKAQREAAAAAARQNRIET